jgi:hypothetical protein
MWIFVTAMGSKISKLPGQLDLWWCRLIKFQRLQTYAVNQVTNLLKEASAVKILKPGRMLPALQTQDAE